MIQDITLGQYFPGNSVIHKLDPRVKILLIVAFIVLLFTTSNFISLAFMTVAVFAVILLTKIPVKMYFKGLKSIIFIFFSKNFVNHFFSLLLRIP